MRIKKKGQGTIEFVIIFGFILIFFTIFFGVIQKNISEKNKDKERILLQNIALDIKDEINLAAESSEGYSREFKVPENILGQNYDIEITDDVVYVSTENNGFAYKILGVVGSIKKGVNKITKQNGMVILED